ncbi:MAG TPA: DUF445 domain-containing protein [Acidimicrobiia bacterium]
MSKTTGPALGSHYEERRIEELRRWKLRANSFLFGAFIVFLASHFLGSESGVNGFVRAASEAALIGGIADWFAVTALFRHPLGIPIPHTALIPKSKDEIGTGLAEFVQQNFLDPANLRQWIANADIANRLGGWLMLPEHAALAARRSIETGATLAESLDDERVAAVITATSLDWLRQTSVTPLISLVMDTWLKGGHVQESIVAALRGIDLVVEENRVFFRRSFAGSEPWWLPEWARERIFDRVMASFHVLVDEVVADPDHPVRGDLERMLTQAADELRNSAELAARIEETKLRLLDSPELVGAIDAQWDVVHQSLQRSAAAPGSDLERRLTELIQWWGGRVLEDQQLRGRIDNWIADSAERLAQQWDDEVIGLIETTVERWDASEISHRLELQLGRDLQFVRINGTVVGALVGIAIHALLLLTA